MYLCLNCFWFQKDEFCRIWSNWKTWIGSYKKLKVSDVTTCNFLNQKITKSTVTCEENFLNYFLWSVSVLIIILVDSPAPSHEYSRHCEFLLPSQLYSQFHVSIEVVEPPVTQCSQCGAIVSAARYLGCYHFVGVERSQRTYNAHCNLTYLWLIGQQLSTLA